MKRTLAALAILSMVLSLIANATPAASFAGQVVRERFAPESGDRAVAAPAAFPWVSSNGPLGGNFSGIVVSPAYPQDHTVFGFNTVAGVYRSTDSGVTWTAIN